MRRPWLQITECPPTGSDTVVYGKVTAPNGVDPIREAIVYVPSSGMPEEFPGEVSCEVCNSPIGGTPVTQAITSDGTFELRRVRHRRNANRHPERSLAQDHPHPGQ